MITSARNPKVQRLRALQAQAKRRKEHGSFVVEGVRLAEEALMSNWPVRTALITPTLAESDPNLARALEARGVADEVSASVMKALSDTKTPQGVLLEVELRDTKLPETLGFALILDGIADPGNLGTLLRTAAAADCDAVLLAPGCADAWSPKVLRSAMGAHFRQPILAMDWPSIERTVKANNLHAYLAEAWQGEPYDLADFTKPVALILGGEAQGASADALALKPTPVQIPMPGRMESLNVATAGSILIFEVVRQRRAAQAK
jgi:TrmH family RNA methyltransferase